MLSKISLGLAALSVVSAAGASSQLIGCTTKAQIESLGATGTSGTAADLAGCAAACRIENKWYSFYSASDSSCFCTSTLSVDSSPAGQGSCSDYSISIIRPSLSASSSNSAAQAPALAVNLIPVPAPSPDAQADSAASAAAAAVKLPNTSHLSPQPKVMRPPQKRAAAPACQSGEVACATLAGAGTGFECVNVKDNAQYCGGCPNGLFQQDPSTASGRDCTRLPPPGAAHLSTICYNAHCAATECQPGYKWLPDGSCIWKGGMSYDAHGHGRGSGSGSGGGRPWGSRP